MGEHSRPEPVRPVIVGVDGSHAALNAVRWASAEAVDHDVPLRIVHVVSTQAASGPDVLSGDAILAEAEDAALLASNRVRVQSVRLHGEPGEVLVRQSQNGIMVCIGAGPPQAGEGQPFGRTASALAEAANCSVAVIRSRVDGNPRTTGVIAVVLSDEPGNDDVVHLAMREGRLRGATVRQIDQRADSWVRRYPDVPVEVVTAGTGSNYRGRGEGDRGVGLAVVGQSDAARITSSQTPSCHPILGYPGCSVLVVRPCGPDPDRR